MGDFTMKVNESAENYLETILILSKTLPVVRSVDIANELGFKKSSVSVAMKNLREKNHTLLSSWLERLGVDHETAAADACRMEHVISKESFEAIKKHVKD